MTGGLLAVIAGLAVLDSFNPATLVSVTLILLLPGARPVPTALALVAGAFATVAAVGILVFLGASQAAETFDAGLPWLRRIAFGVAAAALLVAGIRRFRTRTRKPVALPGWLTPWTAFPLGVLMTGADLPNAFPYLIAIERLVSAEVPTAQAVLVLAGYALVYCIPCLILLAAGLTHGERVRARLSGLYERYGAGGEVAGSTPRALALLGVGALVATYALSPA